MADDNTLYVKITAEIGEVNEKLKEFEKELKGFADDSGKAVDGVGDATKKVADGLKGVSKSAAKAGASMRAAWIASGIGAVVAVLTVIVQNWGLITGSINRANVALKKHKEYLDDINGLIRERNEVNALNTRFIDVETKEAIQRAKIAGASEAEIFKIRQDGAAKQLEAAQSNSNRADELLRLAHNTRLKAVTDFWGNETEASKKAREEQNKLYAKLEKDQTQAYLEEGQIRSQIASNILNEQLRIINEGTPRLIEAQQTSIQDQVKALGGTIKTAAEQLSIIAKPDIPISFIDDKQLTDDEVKIALHLANLKQQMEYFNEDIKYLIGGAISDTFAELGRNIGEALVPGENVLQTIGQSLIGSLGNFLTQMGAMFVSYGVAQLAFGTATAGMSNPVTAIPSAGVLIAAGAAMSLIGGAISSYATSGGSTPVETGSGGDYGASAIQGSSVSYSNSGAGGGGNYVFEIQGTKLIGVIRNTLDRNKSLGGMDLITSG